MRTDREAIKFQTEGDRLAVRDRWAVSTIGTLQTAGLTTVEIRDVLKRAVEMVQHEV